MPPQFSHHNKGFINFVFCRNWAVRNPAGTRLDSSLVNKQVAPSTAMSPMSPSISTSNNNQSLLTFTSTLSPHLRLLIMVLVLNVVKRMHCQFSDFFAWLWTQPLSGS